MKIAFLTGSLRQGGAERTISTLSGYFARKRHEIIIYTMDNPQNDFFAVSSDVQEKYIQTPDTRFICNILKIAKLREQLRKDRPDWLLTFDTRTLVYGVLAKNGKTKVAYAERSNPNMFPSSRIWRQLRRLFIYGTDLNVFQTNSVKELFSKTVQAKSAVIPNAIFNENIAQLTYPEQREEFVAAMGRLKCAVKGFDVLLQAFAMITDKFPRICLKIYGSGPDEKKLLNMARDLGIADRFQIIKGNENAILEVAKARAFVLSSVFEGFPNALLEAMSCGVPCISTDCDFGPRDMIDDKANGLLVPVGDCAAMKKALENILGNREYAEEIGRKAYQSRERYALTSISDLWLSKLQID